MMARYSIILFLFIFLMGNGVAFSQNNANPQDKDSQIIEYLEFREVDIKDALRQLAKQYNLNIVFSESVKGLITLQLHNVSVEQALDAIITVNGFVYTRKGNLIKVTSPEEAEKERKETKVFKLNNAKAANLKETLQKVLSSEGTIEADTRSNSLIITDTPAVLTKIEEMIPDLDEPTPQVLIEARFIETTLGATEKLGIDWAITATATGSTRKITFPFEPKSEDKNMKNVFPPAASTDTDFPTTYGFPYVSKNDFIFGTLSFSDFKLILDFLRSREDTKLISAPRVVTLDNKEAKIHIGETVPIPLFERDPDTGRYNITGYENKELGVTLTVTPQVSPDGRIRLKLKPEVSTITGWTGPTEAQTPITSDRSAETEVVVKDGQTIVIGGLLKNEKTTNITKVPILGDLPLLGLLFTHKQSDPNKRTDLLIFVTAHLIKQDQGSLLAYESNITTSPPRPLKLELREVKVK